MGDMEWGGRDSRVVVDGVDAVELLGEHYQTLDVSVKV